MMQSHHKPKHKYTPEKLERRLRKMLEDEVDEDTLERVVGMTTNALQKTNQREEYFKKQAEQVNRQYILNINTVVRAVIETIDYHGPITREFSHSAAKRIHGNLLEVKHDLSLKPE